MVVSVLGTLTVLACVIFGIKFSVNNTKAVDYYKMSWILI